MANGRVGAYQATPAVHLWSALAFAVRVGSKREEPQVPELLARLDAHADHTRVTTMDQGQFRGATVRLTTDSPSSPSPALTNATVAARILGLDRQTLINAISVGQVRGARIGHRWYVASSFVEQFS
jgi:2-methylcitrate dehydratase PrpD